MRSSSLKTIVFGLLVTCLLLSTCAVRKSIESFLLGSTNTEASIGNRFKKAAPTNDKEQFSGHQLCSSAERTALQSADFTGPRFVDSLLPHVLFLTILIGFIPLALVALLHASFSTFYLETSFASSGIPLYIKNRLLLI